jgi:hypothetical protein
VPTVTGTAKAASAEMMSVAFFAAMMVMKSSHWMYLAMIEHI